MIVFIQARSNSKRFRNKILKKIYGLPIIMHVVNKVKKAKLVKDLIVATSKNKTDDTLIKTLKSFKIKYFRGELDNVALRFLNLAKKKKCKYFARVSGDSPLLDYQVIDKAIKIHKKNKSFDLISNVFPRTFPKGQSIEIIKVKSLENNIQRMSSNELEHVTRYFYKNKNNFKIKNFKNNSKKKFIKLSIDTAGDFNKIKNRIRRNNFVNFKLNDF
tara:strand:+ start:9026 stop:9673 length:648 start_codon:yes stop_codon:yes gene_type:complete